MSKRLTLADAKHLVRPLGFTLVKRDGEYIVKPAGSSIDDPRSYFTNDLLDAVQTARAMHAHEAWRIMRDAIGSDLAALLGPD